MNRHGRESMDMCLVITVYKSMTYVSTYAACEEMHTVHRILAHALFAMRFAFVTLFIGFKSMQGPGAGDICVRLALRE